MRSRRHHWGLPKKLAVPHLVQRLAWLVKQLTDRVSAAVMMMVMALVCDA
jgi:hypothetical protein